MQKLLHANNTGLTPVQVLIKSMVQFVTALESPVDLEEIAKVSDRIRTGLGFADGQQDAHSFITKLLDFATENDVDKPEAQRKRITPLGVTQTMRNAFMCEEVSSLTCQNCDAQPRTRRDFTTCTQLPIDYSG